MEIGFVLHSRLGWAAGPLPAPPPPGAAGLPMTRDRSGLGNERVPQHRRPGPPSGREAPRLVPERLGLFLQTPPGAQFTPNSFTPKHLKTAPHELASFGISASGGRRSPPPHGRFTQIGFVLHSRPGWPRRRGDWLRFVKYLLAVNFSRFSFKPLMSQATPRQLALFYISASSKSRHHRDAAVHGNWLCLTSSARIALPRPAATKTHHLDRKIIVSRGDADEKVGKRESRKERTAPPAFFPPYHLPIPHCVSASPRDSVLVAAKAVLGTPAAPRNQRLANPDRPDRIRYSLSSLTTTQ